MKKSGILLAFSLMSSAWAVELPKVNSVKDKVQVKTAELKSKAADSAAKPAATTPKPSTSKVEAKVKDLKTKGLKKLKK